MDTIKLAAKSREEKGRKTNQGRRQGLVPAVIYGKKINTQNLWIDGLEFNRLLDKTGESTIINLDIDDKKGRNVIINEVQRDPVSHQIIHADFFQVRMDEKIETKVELVYIGEAPAVKEFGGVLIKNISEIEVKCLPADLPSHIDVDISVLNTFEDHITVKDLKVSPAVELELEPETTIALVMPPRSEEELKELEEKVEEDVSKVEGVAKEKSNTEHATEGETESKAEDKTEGEK